MDSDRTTPDTLKAILLEVKATRDAAERAANSAIEANQRVHDFVGTALQKLTWRVEKLEMLRFPVRRPWLALVMATISLMAVAALAWKVL